MNNNLKQQTPLPPPPRDEGPLNVDVPLENQTRECLIALVEAMDKQAKDNEKRGAALKKTTETAIQMRDHLVAFINCLCEKDHKLFSEICRDPRISEYAGSVGQFGTALADLDALTPAPEKKNVNV